ncbi:unnamed protein product [Adineta ricciae]|uniref:3CxxC-type domain-containing protein n=1 Tax=Adineta ricciae TaxID=249248 RepID=A0A814HAW5_ADIRI|nr:unnamed protein product [Adineta ricciae]
MATFHAFQRIFNSSFQFYGLSDWLLELMPDNVNLNHSNNRQSSNGWVFRRHNARSKFTCPNCTEFNSHSSSKSKKVSSWSSAFTTILFRARLDQSHNGQLIGRIQMKIFEQGCQTCNMYSIGVLEEKEIKKTFYRLYLWILKTFYNVRLADNDDDQDEPRRQEHIQQTKISHDSSRCDGCRLGWCKALYTNRNK